MWLSKISPRSGYLGVPNEKKSGGVGKGVRERKTVRQEYAGNLGHGAYPWVGIPSAGSKERKNRDG